VRPEFTSMATGHMEKIPKLANNNNNKGSGGTVPIGTAGLARYV
jgi:hypothetical protein